MIYPRMTNNPHADADARDRWEQMQRDNYKKLRCIKCHLTIDDGEEYFDVPDEFGDSIVICENCINDFSKIAFYTIEI